ncbi:MAG: ATP-binding protein [Elusimicrobiota bacterium]|nr:ATP-binding protein [Elusimicrobiota bacterium]
MIKSNPFTPQSGWEPKSFQGRKNHIDNFKKNIKNILLTDRPNHMVILGDWGIGKTSLLKLFKKIAQKEGLLTTFCAIPKFTEKDLTADVVNLIIEEILKGFPFIKGMDKLMEEIEGIGISIAGFGGQVTRKKKQGSPQLLLTDVLMRLWKYLDTKLAIVIIDDIQNFSMIPQVLDILRLVLSREEILVKTNYLFILSSTSHGWNDFIDKHDPIGRFFRKRGKIQPLNKEETKKVIAETLKNTEVKFSKEIIELAYSSTMGHPYELQVLCSNLYESQIKGVVSKRQWPTVFNKTLYDLGEDYFDSLFRRASEREETILQVLSKDKKEMSIPEIQNSISKTNKLYPAKDVRLYIYRLLTKELVKQQGKGKYQIVDNMFREYLINLSLQ